MPETRSVAVVLVTVGRSSLADAIRSVLPQLAEGDELLVCPDGPHTCADQVARQFTGPIRVLDLGGPHQDEGRTLRAKVQEQAAGRHVLHITDAETLAEGAVEACRAAAPATPAYP